MKTVIIIGLPGSGKTFLINNIKDKYDIIIDDFVTPDSILSAIESQKDGIRLILSDPVFCSSSVLRNVMKFLEENKISRTEDFELVYFENNKKQCKINASQRPFKKVDGFIDMLSKEYFPVNPIPVYSGKEVVDD